MSITNDNMIEMLKKVVEVLQIEDDEKVDLAIDILTLIINYFGAENIMGAIGDGLDNAMDFVSELVTGESSDLSAEERLSKLEQTRNALDDLFEKMAALQDV